MRSTHISTRQCHMTSLKILSQDQYKMGNYHHYLLKRVNMACPRDSSFVPISIPSPVHWVVNSTSSTSMGTQRNAAGCKLVVGEVSSRAWNGMQTQPQWNGIITVKWTIILKWIYNYNGMEAVMATKSQCKGYCIFYLSYYSKGHWFPWQSIFRQ